MICTEETCLMSKLDFVLAGLGPMGGAWPFGWGQDCPLTPSPQYPQCGLGDSAVPWYDDQRQTPSLSCLHIAAWKHGCPFSWVNQSFKTHLPLQEAFQIAPALSFHLQQP